MTMFIGTAHPLTRDQLANIRSVTPDLGKEIFQVATSWKIHTVPFAREEFNRLIAMLRQYKMHDFAGAVGKVIDDENCTYLTPEENIEFLKMHAAIRTTVIERLTGYMRAQHEKMMYELNSITE